MTRALVGCLACAFLGTLAAPAAAQPFGYVVNAADPTDDGSNDNLWRINLGTGSTERIGALDVVGAVNSDVEGLALESTSSLYGVDDATDSLLAINIATGMANTLDRPSDNLRLGLNGAPLDPGLGFDCAGRLLMTSVTRETLYSLNKFTGQASVIGGEGRLGARIGDLAVRGDDVYGIGVAGDEGLYRIDATAGTATLVGDLGLDFELAKAGLDFDRSGNLWAIAHIIDGDGQPQPSQVLSIDLVTGAARLGPLATLLGSPTERADADASGPTTLTGIKSLAVAPVECGPFEEPPPPPPPPPPPRGDEPVVAVPVAGFPGLLVLVLAIAGIAWFGRFRP